MYIAKYTKDSLPYFKFFVKDQFDRQLNESRLEEEIDDSLHDAILKLIQNDKKEALKNFEHTWKLSRKYADTKKAFLWLWIINGVYKSGDLKRAREMADVASEWAKNKSDDDKQEVECVKYIIDPTPENQEKLAKYIEQLIERFHNSKDQNERSLLRRQALRILPNISDISRMISIYKKLQDDYRYTIFEYMIYDRSPYRNILVFSEQTFKREYKWQFHWQYPFHTLIAYHDKENLLQLIDCVSREDIQNFNDHDKILFIEFALKKIHEYPKMWDVFQHIWENEQKDSKHQPDSNEISNIIDFAEKFMKEVGDSEKTQAILEKGLEAAFKVDPLYQDNAIYDVAQAMEKNGHKERVEQIYDDLSKKRMDTPLINAARKGNVEEVRRLLQSGAHVNAKNKDKITALGKAAYKGYYEIVKLLLDHGAEVDVQSVDGETPLMTAAAEGRLDVVKLLLEHHANVNIRSFERDIGGTTPLMAAASSGNVEMVNLFLEKGAKMDTKDMFERTALMLAVAGNHADVVKLLLEKGANVNHKTHSGVSSLSMAADGGYANIVKVLLEKGADPNVKSSNGETPLILAQKAGHQEVVHILAAAQNRAK